MATASLGTVTEYTIGGNSWTNKTTDQSTQNGDNNRYYLGTDNGNNYRPRFTLTVPSSINSKATITKLVIKIRADQYVTPKYMRGFLTSSNYTNGNYENVTGSGKHDEISYLWLNESKSSRATASQSSGEVDCYLVFDEGGYKPGTTYYVHLLPYDSDSAANGSPTFSGTWWRGRNREGYYSATCTYLGPYTVTYDANGGTGAPDNQTKTYGTDLKLSTTTPTKNKSTSTYTVTYNTNGGNSINSGSATKTTTYNFTNWSGNDGKTYAAGATYATNANLTLTANYSSTDSTTTVTLPTPTQDGKNFKGWYLKSDFSGDSYAAGTTYKPTGNTTFYAKWETKTYTISYNANGHGTAPASQEKTHGTSLTLQPFISNVTETGYTVSYNANGGTTTPNASSATTITHKQTYWNTNKSGSGTNYSSKGTYSDNSAATLYAIWSSSSSSVTLASAIKKNQTTKDGYKVTYDAQDGICNTASETAKNTVTYTFSKWAEGSTTGTKYSAGVSYTPTADVTMYATWSESVSNGSVTLPTPTRDSYEFVGWVTSTSNGTNVGKGGQSYTPEKDLTLYAKWEQSTYTVIFDANGGTGEMDNQSIKVGVSTKLNANNFSKTGYTFSGWSTEQNGTKKYNNQASVTDLATAGKTYTLYAVWKANEYTVTYKSSSAYNSETETQTITYGIPWTTYPADTFSKTGQTIDSWNTRSTGTGGTKYDVSKEYSTYQNLTLYAQWKAKTYTLSYDANGGNNPPGDQTWTYGSSTNITISSQKPTREGYTFQGWAESANATSVAHNPGAKISSTKWASDTTLYAVWTANTYTVIFDANGGTGEMDNQPFTYDKAQNLFTNEFTKAGFIFKGWTDSNDNTYSDKASVINLTTTQNGTVKMIAIWERGVYNLTIKPNGGTLLSNNTTNDITTKFAYKTLTISYSINLSEYNSINISFSYGATLQYSNSCVDPNTNGGKLELSNPNKLNSITSNNCNNYLKGKYILFNNQIYLIHEDASFSGTTNSGSRKLVCDQAALCSISEKPKYGYEPNNSAVKNDYIFTGYTASKGSVFQNTTGSSFYFDGENEDNNDDWEMDTETYVFDGNATEDVTITTQFRKKNYTVQYELNNSKITDQSSFSEAHDYGDIFTLPSFTTTQIYEFLGWNTKADGSGTAYDIESQVSNLSDVDGTIITLYAQWKLKNLVQVYHGGKFENAQMFVWTDNQWTLATTYVWKSGEWEMSTGK